MITRCFARCARAIPLAVVASLLATTAAARPLHAQDVTGVSQLDGPGAAYFALTVTPVGALAPLHDFLLRRPGGAPMPMRLHASFGAIDRGSGLTQRTFAATLDMPVGASSLALTAGYLDLACNNDATGGLDVGISCRGGVTLGARVGRPLASHSMDTAGTSALVLGVEASAGFADIDIVQLGLLGDRFDVKGQGLSVVAALPLALVVHSGTTIISPSIRPGVGWGHAKVDVSTGESDTNSGVRAMIGAGVAVRLGPRIGLDFGLQHVFADQSDTALGLAISYGF